MAKPKLTARQEAYAKAVVLNGGDKVAAYKTAGYSTNMKADAIYVKADEVYNNGKVSVRVSELQKTADKVANKVFTISVQQRLEWLSEIRVAGMGTYNDVAGNERRENLNASNAAIKTMNEMLGTGDSETNAEALNITFTVKAPVGEIKITKGE
jgi:hypothetical protein